MSGNDIIYGLAHTKASQMLSKALQVAQDKYGMSQRDLAKKMNYQSSVVISHMASGRVPIPVDRSLEFARFLEMNRAEFLMAVLNQRHPDIDFQRILFAEADKRPAAENKGVSSVVEDLEMIAGTQLDKLNNDTMNVIKAVLSDSNPQRRWCELNELPVLDMLRKARKDLVETGMTAAQREKLRTCIENL